MPDVSGFVAFGDWALAGKQTLEILKLNGIGSFLSVHEGGYLGLHYTSSHRTTFFDQVLNIHNNLNMDIQIYILQYIITTF